MYSFLKKHKNGLVYAPLVFYWLLLILLTSLPGESLPNVKLSDKIEHFLAYFGLGILLNLALLVQDKFKILKKYPVVFTFLFGTLYGYLDELHQKFIPGRTYDLNDWLADTIGTLLGIILINVVLRIFRPGSSKSNKTNIFLPIILILTDLFLIWFVKYEHHDIPLKEFSITYIGNLFNLVFAVLTIIGLIILHLTKKQINNKTLFTYLTLITVFLFAGIATTLIKFPLPKTYLLDHPFPEVLTGFLFCVYQYIQFVFLSVIWIRIIGGKELVLLTSLVNGVIILLLFFFITFIYLNRNVRINKLSYKSNNTAVVLGAAVWSKNEPSPSFASRIDKAAYLYKSKIADKIQLTGSNAPGELSEAEVAFNRLRAQNIDSKDIMLEKKSTSTAEQVNYIKNKLIAKKKIDRIIIVSDSYHLTRVSEICGFYNVKADIIASDFNLNLEHKIYYKMRESIALMIFWFFAL